MNNKQWQIGAVKIDGQAILAPMAGSAISLITYLLKSMGPLWFAPKWSAPWAINIKIERTHELLRIEDAERPVSMQIFGSKSEAIAIGHQVVADAGADIVDINMGCPVKRCNLW